MVFAAHRIGIRPAARYNRRSAGYLHCNKPRISNNRKTGTGLHFPFSLFCPPCFTKAPAFLAGGIKISMRRMIPGIDLAGYAAAFAVLVFAP
jgi:hypothetical protein